MSRSKSKDLLLFKSAEIDEEYDKWGIPWTTRILGRNVNRSYVRNKTTRVFHERLVESAMTSLVGSPAGGSGKEQGSAHSYGRSLRADDRPLLSGRRVKRSSSPYYVTDTAGKYWCQSAFWSGRRGLRGKGLRRACIA